MMAKTFGRMLKTKTVHGVRTGAHSNPNVLRSARAYGGACGEADGGSARPSFAKASRMKRADGGPTISEDSKKEVERLRDETSHDRRTAAMNSGIALGLMGTKGMKAIPKAINRTIVGANGLLGAAGAVSAYDKSKEADRIEKGMAEPGREDGPKLRAFGGRVKMRDGSKWKKGDATENESGREYKNGGWIAGATKNKGALHKALGVPQGEKIPEKKLEKAEHSDNPTMRKRAALAETLKGFKK